MKGRAVLSAERLPTKGLRRNDDAMKNQSWYQKYLIKIKAKQKGIFQGFLSIQGY